MKLATGRTIGSENQGLKPSGALGPTEGVAWDQAYWDQTYWDQTYWDAGANFD